ncbi:MAG: serine/threonine-protein kinase, partial [Pseudonocardiaceae bacterium]
VWRSHDELLRRDVAIKEVIIPPGVPVKERDLLCERMLREARAAAALNHPAVVSIFDVVTDSNRPWIVMELLEADSIADIIRDTGPMSVEKVAEAGLAVLGALDTAHAAGVLHRDVKPGNVLITHHGRVVLTDFGAARSPNDTPLTSTGLLLGSPQYIAPERARGRPFGPASDLFSLGSSLYAAVEGKPPFDRGDPLSTMTAVVCEPPDEMVRAGALAPILTGLLAKNPSDRWDIPRATEALRHLLQLDSVDDEQAPRHLEHRAENGETAESALVHQAGGPDVSTRQSRKRRATVGVSDAGTRRSATVRRGARRNAVRPAEEVATSEDDSTQTNSAPVNGQSKLGLSKTGSKPMAAKPGSTSSELVKSGVGSSEVTSTGRHRRLAATGANRRSAKRTRRAQERNSSWRHKEHKSPIRMWLALFALLVTIVGGGFAIHYFTTQNGTSATANTESP